MIFECHFKSSVLNLEMGMNVVLPQIDSMNLKKRPAFPVLYLLHGYSDNYTCWLRKSSIERYAMEAGLAVVMPEAYKTFYSNLKGGFEYFTFLSQELPRFVEACFPVSTNREDRFVAGLSMGGYGAFKLALTCPDQFSAGASLSGALDGVRIAQQPEHREEMEAFFGDLSKIQNTEQDLFYLVKRLSNHNLRLYQSCGTEDFLYQDNLKFREFAKAEGLDLTYYEEPGAHTWDYWDRNIQRVIHWLMKGRSL